MPASTATVVRLRREADVDLSDMSREEIAAFLQVELQQHFMATREKIHRFADRAGVSDHTISKLLYGDTLYPRGSTILHVLSTLGWRVIARPAW